MGEEGGEGGAVKLVIVGAGPHALTALLRLIHAEPELLPEGVRSTIANHERPMNAKVGPWQDCKRTVQNMTSRKRARIRECDLSTQFVCDNIRVIDRHGHWMNDWKEAYESLSIPFLRSPVDVHPSPGDPRELFCYEIQHSSTYIGFKKDSKTDGGFCGPFLLPSTELFNDFCDQLITSFGLEQAVEQGEVTDIIPPTSNCSLFTLVLSDNTQVLAENVILAPGPIMRKCPMFWEHEVTQKERIIHSEEIVTWIPTIKTTIDSVVICGGGITSVHTAIKLLESELARQVTIMCRSELRLQQFDVGRQWFGCKRGGLLKKFWEMEHQSDRILYCREQRGGGSISHEVFKLLEPYLENGSCRILENSEIYEVADGEDELNVYLASGEELACDTIVLAVGTDVALEEYSFLHRLTNDKRFPVTMELPAVRPDLTWGMDGLFVMGALAMGELGPDALNLTGARHAACRIAKKLRPILRGDKNVIDRS